MECRTDAFLIAFFFDNNGTTGVTRTVAQKAAEKGRVRAARTICEDVSHSPCR
jgi:ribosomal 50S subunit-recycling heat shock protein